MSVSNQTNKTYGSGNGVTTTFSYPFKIFDVSELYAYTIVTATGIVTGPLVYNTDFTATISTVTEGGTITFVVAPATGTTWFLKRVVPQTQSAVIPSEGTFPGKQFENQLDLLTMMAIQTNEAVTRCAQLAATSLVAGVTLPDPIDGYALAWSGTAGQIINFPITATTLTAAIAAAAASATAAASSASTASSAATASAASAAASAASAASINAGSIWPIGSVFISTVNTNPHTLLGFGTWTALGAGRVLMGVGTGTDINSVTKTVAGGDTGGEYVHTQTLSELVPHTHTYYNPNTANSTSGSPEASGGRFPPLDNTGSTGSGTAFNVVQPYLGVYMWNRTA